MGRNFGVKLCSGYGVRNSASSVRFSNENNCFKLRGNDALLDFYYCPSWNSQINNYF